MAVRCLRKDTVGVDGSPGTGFVRPLISPAILSALTLLLLAGQAGAEEFQARVVGVTDGDTLTVLLNGRAAMVRLLGIDAPEKGQPYGQRAKQFTASLAFGQTVTVWTQERDRYGRLLAEVILPDGRSLNQELVRAGYAWWFRRYSTNPVLARLEANARVARRGLWVDQEPVPPWQFRRVRPAPGRS
jgi:endonuclease YncB( thermonuclease family)